MTMGKKDVLIVNSTIITGILILLTVSQFQIGYGDFSPSLRVAAIIIILPFSISSSFELWDATSKKYYGPTAIKLSEQASRKALFAMLIGFVYLAAVLFVFGFLSTVSILKQGGII